MKGNFIVIEGTDGSGKTTQLGLLKDHFEKKELTVKTLDYPKYDEFWGKVVGRFLAGEFGGLEEVSPYLASPLYLLDQSTDNNKINDWISNGYVVLSNRYVTSSMAHQTAKFLKTAGTFNEEAENFLKWLEEAAFENLNLINPDLVITLFVEPKHSMELSKQAADRKKVYTNAKDIAEVNLDHQQKSAFVYKWLTENRNNWKLVNCMNNQGQLMKIEEIHEKILEILY